MKHKKQSIKTGFHGFSRRAALVHCMVVGVVVLAGLVAVPRVRADQFDEQIAQLQQQNAGAKNSLNDLLNQASSYQDAINKLQAQINDLQSKINANLAQQAALQQQITDNQAKLNEQKAVLGSDIKAMYVDGQPTTLEMLASSGNLSDFVDKEQYRTNVQNKIQDTLQKINDLQSQLKRQKEAVDGLLQDQQGQQGQLADARGTQSALLSKNQQDQASFNQQIASNQSKIGDLRKQQAILNARYNIGTFTTSPDHGGYPDSWNNAPQDSLIDPWGMYNRECVSFTAFKVHQAYLGGKTDRDMPYWGGIGNANQWDDNARAVGIPVDSNPTAGSVAISNAGAYGHAMWVQAVSPDKTQIYVQQYNQQLTGQYSEGWRYTTGLVFLHF
ncbi:MAG TPA: CHAP domain-containing protein [Candidatus Saccharimonadales bacterium]|nr:CHAP domain-containing protein [Candidatus Saccharimonadales bacterium]